MKSLFECPSGYVVFIHTNALWSNWPVKFISEKLGHFLLPKRTKQTNHLQILDGSDQKDAFNRI